MEPMTKEEAEKFLETHSRPWRTVKRCNQVSIIDADDFFIVLNDLLRYFRYVEQENRFLLRHVTDLEQSREAMQGLIDIMGDGN